MLDKFFDFKNRETEIYKLWEKAGCFKPENASDPKAKVFDITMPPPNANGELHIGHCYGHTVMDILGRYHRALGERVLLIPGKDHAGIQTQVVYEKKLRSEGIDTEKLSPMEFWKSCYDFCIDRSAYMRAQEKLVGVSADFDREVFTLEPGVSDIVLQTFVKMWEDGLVYRGSRIVHWSVYSQTSISDVEIEYKEEKGNLWHIEYPLVEAAEKPARRRVALGNREMHHNIGNHWVILGENLAEFKVGEAVIKLVDKEDTFIERDYIVFKMEKLPGHKTKPEQLEKYNDQIRAKILAAEGELSVIDLVLDLDNQKPVVVATTRPETMLGDTAVSVHPMDPRYTHLIGKKVRVPIIGREIPIIADDRIDISFGTGAVKTTPAHDFLDYEIGKDHGLEQIQVIDKFGKMTRAAGSAYEGLSIADCRQKLVTDLQQSGSLLLTEEMMHKVPIAERGKDIVEPLISTQWFVNVDKEGLSLKKRALELINSGRIAVHPARMKHLIVQWLENLTDWNISRQIIWGHKIPAWYKNKDTDQEEIHVGMEAPDGEGWVAETDTFDTWFSSGQWPYSTLSSLGLLDLENPSKSEYFPTNTMVMGRDILLFWACRMMILSSYRMNDIPWKNIYFTGLVRDAKGQKMSKSKGNGVEPKEMLTKYGADALRVGLIAGTSAGLDPKFDEKKLDNFSKYLNKIWNAAKLVAIKGEGDYQLKLPALKDLQLSSSAWILGYIAQTQRAYKQRLDNYEISNAFDVIYQFSWDIYCSWYLEMAKIELEVASEHTEEIKAVMFAAFREILKMLHAFMPFFTEEIWMGMENLGGKGLLAEQKLADFSEYETALSAQSEARVNVQKLIDIVSVAREVRRTLEKPFGDRLTIDFDGTVDGHYPQMMDKMINADFAEVTEGIFKPCPTGMIRVAANTDEKNKFRDNLEKTLAKKEQEVTVLEKILTPGFKAKADPDLVAEREAQLAAASADRDALRADLEVN